ncbi:MAG: S8 family peptidase [Elusimicrobiota bacterium]
MPAVSAWASGGKRYIVGFKQGVDDARQKDILDSFGLADLETLDIFNAKIVEAPADRYSPSAFRMMSNPDIYYVEEDFYTNWLVNTGASFQARPLPSFGAIMADLPKLKERTSGSGEQPWGIVRVNAEKGWAQANEGSGVRVAVIDTGVDFNHPDLQANYKGGYNAVDADKPPLDDHGHGTHVAGTIAAVKDGKGVVGVAPQAHIYAVKVLDKDGGGSLTSIVKGLVWAANNNIQVANMSLGAPMGSIFMRLAVKYATSKGVAIIAAAGNSGGAVGYPAAYEDTIAIAASDSSDRVASFSSRGEQVDFIAPGVDVNSTVVGGKYARYSGTSMATPHAAGLAALAVKQGANGKDAVKAYFLRAAKKLPGVSENEQGEGMIDAALLRRK